MNAIYSYIFLNHTSLFITNENDPNDQLTNKIFYLVFFFSPLVSRRILMTNWGKF